MSLNASRPPARRGTVWANSARWRLPKCWISARYLELVSLRGRLMADADPEHVGTMYAILRLSLEEVEDAAKNACEKTGKLVRVANRNTPGQFAISGHKEAVEELLEQLKGNKGKAIPLAVSGAFHTPLMAEASTEFSRLLDKMDWHDAAFPVYCNVSGEALTAADQLHAAMRKQMTSSVYWIDVISNQWKNGVRRWIRIRSQGGADPHGSSHPCCGKRTGRLLHH